jgi:hypothetical protein
MPLIIPANSITGGFEVANSLRFDDGSSDYLSRTPSSAGNRKTWTWSGWLKMGVGSNGRIFGSGTSGTEKSEIAIAGISNTSGLNVRLRNDSGDGNKSVTLSAVQRDPSAWYHLVVGIDTTQATDTDRIKIYINGELQTSFSSASYPSQNVDTYINSTNQHNVGALYDGSTGSYYDGYLAECVFIDGQQLDPTSFGEFDEDTGIWKPIDVSGLTFGTNGFYLDFENSGSLGADVSGNGNNFTVNNLTSIDQTTDTPTNNYSTLNPLNVPTSNAPTFSEGNLKTVCGTTGGAYMGSSTIGVSSGKWYVEMKVKTVDSVLAGISANASEDARDNVYPGQQADSVGILLSNGQKYINDSGSTYGASLSANDILQIALDLDNNNVYFGKNGQWSNGSGSWNQSSPSSAISITASSNTTDGFYFFSVGDGGGSQAGDVEWNFGNPSFTILSGNSDGNGYGNFEHAVPSGYYSLNTKNLAEYG